MTYAPHKLVPEGFTPLQGLAALPQVAAATTAPASADSVAHLVTADGDLPDGIGASRSDLTAAGFEADAGSSFVFAAGGTPVVLVGLGASDDVTIDGHAVEARLYAEDPDRGFLPSTGRLIALRWPAGVRIDTGVEQGSEITLFYDPLIAKLIAHAPTRDAALDRLAIALGETVAAGPRTNLPLLAALCRAPEFRSGAFDTGFIERNLAGLGPGTGDPAAAAAGAALARPMKVFQTVLESANPNPNTVPVSSTTTPRRVRAIRCC